MEPKTTTLDLEALAELYDEHQVRTATYLGRDLTDQERSNLAIQGLTEAIKGESIERFERAADRLGELLKAGETIGQALAQAITDTDRG